MPAKLDRCVQKVKGDSDVSNPWAVCNAQINEVEGMLGDLALEDNKQSHLGSNPMIDEGGVGSGIKGHTTPVEKQNLEDAETWINAYSEGGMNDEEIRAKLEGMGIPHQTINQAFHNAQTKPPEEDYGYVDKRTDDEIKKQIDDVTQTYIAQGQSPDTASRWANASFGRRTPKQKEGGQGSGPQQGKKNGGDSSLKDWNPTTLGGKIFGPSFLPGADWVTKKVFGDEAKPLTMKESKRMIREMQATPMTGSTKRMSGGSKGKAPHHWTPADFNKLHTDTHERLAPEARVKEQMGEPCPVCGTPQQGHEIQDHPFIPPLPQEQVPPPMPNGMMPSPQPNQPPNVPPMGMPPQENNMPPEMPPEMPPMPPQNMPPPMPQELPPEIPPEEQMQYTTSVPNSLSAVSIGGKKVNEMIREIESAISK